MAEAPLLPPRPGAAPRTSLAALASPPHSPDATPSLPPAGAASPSPRSPGRAHHDQTRRGPTPTTGPTLVVAMAAEGVLQVVVRPRQVRRVVAPKQAPQCSGSPSGTASTPPSPRARPSSSPPGEVRAVSYVRIGAGGRIERCHLRDPSWFLWPLLEGAIEGNIVADFPLCNKSFNCSYSGHDL